MLPARTGGAAALAAMVAVDGAREGMVGKDGVGWRRAAGEVAAGPAAVVAAVVASLAWGSVRGAAAVPAHSLRSGGPKKRREAVCVRI